VTMISLAPSESITEKKIASFSALPAGWRYGDGGPLRQETLNIGLRLLRLFYQLGLTHTDAFAGEAGELTITAYHESDYVELVIESDRTITLIHEANGEAISHFENIHEPEALGAIREIARAIWNTSAYSIQMTTTGFEADLSAWPSRIRVTGESLLFNATAWPVPGTEFAPTPAYTTDLVSIQNSSSSGDLTNPFFLPRAA
jgi:hypothetical protein